jgi:nucleotide-binding universal stress UspA family protein
LRVFLSNPSGPAEDIVQSCKKDGLSPSYIVSIGDPLEIILDIAKKEKVSLIVMEAESLTSWQTRM